MELETGAGAFDDYYHLNQLFDIIHYTPDYRINEALDSVFNMENVLRYFALLALLDDFDYTCHNHYLHRVGSTGKWHIIPWDLNLAFQNSERPPGLGSFQRPGDVIAGPNILITRIMAVDSFRNRYCDLIDSLSYTLFDSTHITNYVDSLVNYIRTDAHADNNKNSWENNVHWDYIQLFFAGAVLNRVSFLRTQLEEFRELPNHSGIVINELCVNNTSFPDKSW